MGGPAALVDEGSVLRVIDELVSTAQRRLAEKANPADAAPMAAYMKTDQPFYGVKAQPRRVIARQIMREFPISDGAEYEEAVSTMWALPHREEQYLAIDLAIGWSDFVTLDRLPLYRRMVIEGAWWDLVDGIASKLVGRLMWEHRDTMTPIMEQWIDDDDMWIRRTAILSQLGHKAETDAELLFEFCRRRAHEKEFFIRKAIGWALREYAKADPDAVRGFVAEMSDQLSGLSRREATKHL